MKKGKVFLCCMLAYQRNALTLQLVAQLACLAELNTLWTNHWNPPGSTLHPADAELNAGLGQP